jgi:tetratricopeptide (TPR) repeat protein
MTSLPNRPFISVTCVAGLFLVLALTRLPAALPPDAQAALDQGLSAAKLQQWTVAIRNFNQARAAAPDAPEPLFNLGLAESQIKGRELRAICWFEAYLALTPNAANAAAVRKQIADLEIRVEGNADQMIGMLKSIGGKYPDSYWSIAGLLAENGDPAGAEEFYENANTNSIARGEGGLLEDIAVTEMAKGLARAGKLKEALVEADKDSDPRAKDDVREQVAEADMTLGQFPEAAGLINQISADGEPDKLDKLFRLVQAENAAGLRDQAMSFLSDMRGQISQHEDDAWAHESLAATESELGQKDDAEGELRRARELIARAKGPMEHYHRMNELCNMALVLNEMGRRSQALSAMHDAESESVASENAKEGAFDTGRYEEYYLMLHDWDAAESYVNEYNSDPKNPGLRYFAIQEINDAMRSAAVDEGKATALAVLRNSASSPVQRAQAWADYLKTCLSLPLFTDFNATVAGLEQDLPKDAGTESIFNHVKTPALELLDRLGDIRTLRAVSQPLGNVPAETKGP